MSEKEIIYDEEIERVHGSANFGQSYTKRDIVRFGVLKAASGYYQGSTSRAICEEHGLIDKEYELTEKGRKYLWVAFGNSNF